MRRWLLHRTTRSLAATAAAAMLTCAPALHAQGKGGAKDAAPPPPDKLWAAQTSPTEIRLQWNQVPRAVAYRVFCAVGSAAPRLAGTVAGSGGARNPAEALFRMLTYVVRVTSDAVHRCFVEALDEKGRVSNRTAFNEVTPVVKAAVSASVSPPQMVTATETAPGEITLTWDEVPGATAYYIGRSVFPNGLQRFCDLCPTGGRYVDRNVTPGVKHTYAVAAVTPTGVSRRTTSNTVTPGSGGAGDVATTTGDTAQDLPPKGATNVRAVSTGPGMIVLTWQGVFRATAYRILRQFGGGPVEQIAQVAEGQLTQFRDRVSSAVGGAVRYAVVAVNPKGAAPPVWSNEVPVAKDTVPDKGPDPTPTPVAQSCTLEYQRADNSFADWGRADGDLGTETITLKPGETRILFTDWKYEKRRSDGSNYYGSHLRTATNRGERPVTLLVKGPGELSLSVGGVAEFVKRMLSSQIQGGYLSTLQPGDRARYRHDLMEVSCPAKN